MNNSLDLRWLILNWLALILVVGGAPHYQRKTGHSGESLEGPSEWRVMDLCWESGKQGLEQGIYCHVREQLLPSSLLPDGVTGAYSVEPHLAVFTFRTMDINRIDFDTLRVIKGVGPKLATAIISHRKRYGPFRRIENLLEVKGVGPAKFKMLEKSLSVNGPE
jgi:competence ComEA-like helix-hairpin-helix protein